MNVDDPERADFERCLLTRLREVLAPTPWLVATEATVGSVRIASELRSNGATSVMAVGAWRGVGAIDQTVPHLTVGVPAPGGLMESMRTAGSALADLPEALRARVEHWNPAGDARVIGPLTMSAATIAGRHRFGDRPREWFALEDKLAVASIWESAGLEVAPQAVVDLADRAALVDADRRLASEQGTVWAVDGDQGIHGGAEGTHRARNRADVDLLVKALADRHRRVRIMPFLDGTPCSIHGMVIGGTAIALRPCEMMVLRDDRTGRFVYARTSTFWAPPVERREQMRAAALALGRHLAAAFDYRGVFTLDGVLTGDGFLPTEVNTRFGAGLSLRPTTVDGEQVDLYFTHLALVEGELFDLDPEAMERWLLGRLDESRTARSFLRTERVPEASTEADVVTDGRGGLWLAEGDDRPPADDPRVLATVEWGDDGAGGLLNIRFGPATPVGPPTAPSVAAVAVLVEEHWRVGIAPLVAASPPTANFV